jgi:riboflavin kinase/FMN adenylyltransferase
MANMRLIRRPAGVLEGLQNGCVATIGTFDGVHLGHQRILRQVVHEARQRGLPSLVFSFEPSPGEYFSAQTPPARLTRFREKYAVLESLDLDWFFCPPFGSALEGLQPDEFIHRFLVSTLCVRHLVIGDDFRFAYRRSGTIDDLRRAGERREFTVEQMGSVTEDGLRISSTQIRSALAEGKMEHARQLLGRYYRMAGRVVGGKKLGKQLGFPTANVNLNRRASPVAGIFAVRVDGLADGLLDGVASVGTRPTVDGVEPLLEVHLFDFERDIYGEHIQVEFVAKLRDEVRFANLERLTEQMHIDAEQARKILGAGRTAG